MDKDKGSSRMKTRRRGEKDRARARVVKGRRGIKGGRRSLCNGVSWLFFVCFLKWHRQQEVEWSSSPSLFVHLSRYRQSLHTEREFVDVNMNVRERYRVGVCF